MTDLSEVLKDVTERAKDYKTMPGNLFPEPKGTHVTTTFRLDTDQMRELELCILAGNAMRLSGIVTFSEAWNVAEKMLEKEPARRDDNADLRAEIDRLSLMLLEKDKRIAELEKQVPKVRLSARITESGEYEEHLFRIHLLGETFPLVQPFTDRKRASKWCADRGFEVVS